MFDFKLTPPPHTHNKYTREKNTSEYLQEEDMATITSSRVPPAGQADTSSTHPFTCNTCQVAFRSSELQRGHMRSDWQ